MKARGKQQGFLLIAAIALIVVLGFLGVVISRLATSNLTAGSLHLTSGQAFYVAESGLERAKYGYMQEGADCSELIYTGAVGKGDFTTTPTYFGPVSTALSAAISATDTVIPLTSTAGLAPAGRVRIDFEDIDYGSIAGGALLGVRRGRNGTPAAAHASGAVVSLDLCSVQSAGAVASARRTVREALITPQAMIVYAKSNGDGTPYFRRWDGNAWSAERSASVVPANINYFVLKFARTRNEAVLGTLSSNGEIHVQVWNGSTWSTPTLLADIGNAGDAERRPFDIEYESVGDRALVLYSDGNATPDFAIWDGSVWTVNNADIPLSLNAELRWVEMAPKPAGDEIAVIAMDNSRRVSGARWTGTAWVDFPGVWGRVADNQFKAIDVAYEQTSGEALFLWGVDQNDRQEWRTWDGNTLGAVALLSIGAMGGAPAWIRLVPDYRPGSDGVMYVVQDQGDNLSSAFWNGAGWSALQGHDGATESGEDRNFDFVFETAVVNRGSGWLVWGNGASVSARRWNGAGWDATVPLGGDDSALVQLIALKKSGTVLGAVYEDASSTNRTLYSFNYRGGVLGASMIWGGATVNNPVHERVVLAEEGYIPDIAWEEVFP